MYALNLDKETGRILSATFEQYAPADAPRVDALPDGNIADYLYQNGEYVYDPLPVPEEPEQPETQQTLEERVAAVETDVADLTAAIERGIAL